MDATIIAALITASGVITAAVITATSQAKAARSPNTQPPRFARGCVFAILSIISLLVGIVVFVVLIRIGSPGTGQGSAPTTNDTTGKPTTTKPTHVDESEVALRSAIEDYYEAVDRGEWSYTYSHLDSETQEKFTEKEWRRQNERLTSTQHTNVLGVDIDQEVTSTEPVGVTVYRLLPDGSCLVRDTYFIYEDGSWKHRFGEEERDIFMQQDSSTAEERASIKNVVRGFYQTQAKGEFRKAYCYAGPAYRRAHGSVESWNQEQEHENQIEDVNINTPPRVTRIFDGKATAYVDVTFEDITGTSNFTGTWTLVKENGQWKLNKPDLQTQ